MIFQFPDLETFRLAVTSAQVPPEVSAAPAEVAFDSDGRPSVRSAAGIPPKAMQNALRKLGVKQVKEHYSESVLSVDCWPQVLPVAKQALVPDVTSNTPVLFEMPASELPTIVTEMLRLGNDRQSFRMVAPADGKGERALLRVIGPPYYTLLRAIDKSTQQGATVIAYLEKSPRVWVEVGHDHVMAGQIKPAEGQVLLLRPDREWSVVADAPFQDVYEVLDFKLPAASVDWQESQLKGKLSVPLRLSAGNAADVAEMWVLTEEAVDQLDALVRDADERLLARLSFAVAEDNGTAKIVLKTRPSKHSPPVLPLAKAQGFKPFWKLPNLFLPVGKRLMPTLRRDAVRRLLADDPAQVVWLMPQADGKFTPEVLPDDAFRPLEDWIDYIIDHEQAALQAWVQATHFDFDGFVCREEQPDRPKPPSEKAKKSRKGDRDAPSEEEAAAEAAKGKRESQAPAEETDFSASTEVIAPSEVKVKLRELEKEFVAQDGPLDSPERQALSAQLARYNALDGRESEAAICWSNAFWEVPEVSVAGSWEWLHAENRQAKKVPTAADLDVLLSERDQSLNAARGFAAHVIHICKQSPVPAWFVERLPRVREYLDRSEGVLGVRAVWLAWWHLARAGGQADVLALARVRDRLLQRLLSEGLNKERDLPYFLRTAGEQNSDRIRLVRDRAMKVHKLVEKWHQREGPSKRSSLETSPPGEVNKPYLALIFAFAMAKIGESTYARDLVQTAANSLTKWTDANGVVHPAIAFIFDAYSWRIENAMRGKPHEGQLPATMIARLDVLDATHDKIRNGAGVNSRYIVERMLHESWIVNPVRGPDPYAKNKQSGTGLIRQLAETMIERDPIKISQSITNLLKTNAGVDDRLRILATAFHLAPKVGEEFTLSLLRLVRSEFYRPLDKKAPPEHIVHRAEFQRTIVRYALFAAAHFDHPDHVRDVFTMFIRLIESQSAEDRLLTVNEFAKDGIRSLRRFGFRDEIGLFLSKVSELVVQGNSFPELQRHAGLKWPELLTSMLAIAEGWLYFGNADKAKPYLDEARATLFEPSSRGIDFEKNFLHITRLVRAYVSVIAHERPEHALDRIDELFLRLGRLPNAKTTGPYYSALHLNIVEDVVRSLISDNMSLGDQARRWLDDDEYLVRRRIHGDMRRLLAQSGL